MSQGSPIVPIRIPPDLLSEMAATWSKANLKRHGEPYCRTSFIIAAIREKLKKMERSRRTKRKTSYLPYVG